MEKQFFTDLVAKYLDGTASPVERRLVETYYEQLSDENAQALPPEKKQELQAEIFGRLSPLLTPPPKVVPLWRSFRFRIAAAAILVLFCAGALYYSLHQTLPMQGSAVLTKLPRFKNDVVPAHQGATLTLADHSVIQLNGAANGTLATQGAMQVLKADSLLSYIGSEATPVYNTIATGTGETYQVQLADGTKVWLDAQSSLHFPTAFPGKQRIVEVTGQAYFEVAKNPKRPFLVQTGRQTIEVLGTHFNVNGFGTAAVTTLLEGSVKVSANGQAQVLLPGEQSLVGRSGDLHKQTDKDIQTTMAWKNGGFAFNGASVQDIMTEIGRWYDIEVEYKSPVTETFRAKISRHEPLSRLLNLLEMTGQIYFTIDGKKITVYNQNPAK